MTLDDCQSAYDVIVIGAGPAGLAAASVCARNGASTLVVDENPAPGGQIYRNVEAAASGDRQILGSDYWSGAELVREARASGAVFLLGATVWSMDGTLRVGVAMQGRARLVAAQRIIIATGALERPFPIRGWTLPGVMTVGAAQTMLKSSALIPHGKTVLAGSGPLIWLYAAQITRAGGTITAILDTTDYRAGSAAWRHLPAFLFSPYMRKGLGLMRQVRSRVRTISNVTALEAAGTDRCTSVRYVANGQTAALPVDNLLLHQGVVPHVNLAMAAGVDHVWDEAQLCFRPLLTENGQTSVDGIAIAGDGAGIAGAEVAAAQGEIAGAAAARALSPARRIDTSKAQATVRRFSRGRSFLDAVFAPRRAMRLPADDVIVCRCEEVTASQVREAARMGCAGPNQLKAFLRCGMGPCQGRLCGVTVTELIAEARETSPGEVGYYRLRAPVKPITLAEFSTIPPDDEAVKAVVRL